MKATAVIGANFGDEGKGLVTDYVCSRAASDGERVLVVRFNGGAQAGHTVVAPDGRRHVFHHFGSGSLAGAGTYLSEFFVANPLLWIKESGNIDTRLPLFANADAPLTTPYDMLINQEAELARGIGRHGSCGVGFGETIERCGAPRFKTSVRDLDYPLTLRARLRAIRDEYVDARLTELVGSKRSPVFRERLMAGNIVDAYLAAGTAMLARTQIVRGIPPGFDRIVFEGAQGLLLDQDAPFFPFVTRSKTGRRNIDAIARAASIDSVEAIYVTRAYVTRHGVGPFPNEDRALRYADATNAPNEFQGSLRFGRLDAGDLVRRILRDSANAKIAVTCLDQVADPDAILRSIKAAGGTVVMQSYGPSRSDVVFSQCLGLKTP